ncbi:MAG: 2-enoyl thioester reductase domain-containing protein [Verrucomicrobiia bacterium]
MRTARVARFERAGPPEEVVRVEEVCLAEPGEGEVLVAMEAAPINPADLNFIAGTYGVKPVLPAVPGLEGCGRVVEVGPGSGWVVGDRVRLPEGTGTWRTHAVVAGAECLRLPGELSAQEAAMLYVNPLTAWRMLHDFVELKAGDWVVQNGANSGVGRCVMGLAKALGLRTVNLVRRGELVAELEALGADKVLVDGPEVPRRWLEEWGGEAPKLGLNAVGGESALRVAGLLGKHGTLVTYGAMSKQALKVPNGMLIFQDLRLRGFWLTAWAKEAGRDAVERALETVAGFARELRVPVVAEYGLEEVGAALAHASREARGGKVLLRLG